MKSPGMKLSHYVGLVTALGAIVGCTPSDSGGEDLGFRLCNRPEAGCECSPGAVIGCTSERALEDENGGLYCLSGVRRCSENGLWGECEYAEDAVRQPIIGDPELCGGCDPACFKVHDCPTQRDLNADNANNVRFDLDADGLVLGGKVYNARYAYIANDPDSTVSKLNLVDGTEVGRYLVGVPGATGWGGNRPSRTAIDSRGDAYVAGRFLTPDWGWPAGMGTVTKIAGDESNCYDRNRDGDIDTSTGGGDLLDWGEDECVLWTSYVGDGCNARALAVDGHDRVWVGCYNQYQFHVLDPDDGTILRTINTDIAPYGAAVSRDGRLWYPGWVAVNGYLQYIDTETYTTSSVFTDSSGCWGSYGVAVDTSQRVMLGGYPSECISRYDPEADSWEQLNIAAGRGLTRGVTVDGSGRIWTASHGWMWGSGDDHWVTSWDSDGSNRTTYTLTGCDTPIGVGADYDGKIWAVCWGTSNVVRLDPDTGHIDLFPVGVYPYTYSDFTGFLRATVTAPEGSYTRLHDSALVCEDGRETLWSQLYYEVDTPPGTRVDFLVRTADRTSDMGMATEVLVASVPGDAQPAEIDELLDAAGVANGMRFMEVRVSLHSIDGDTTPVFRNMNMVYYCVCSCDVDETCTPGCTCDSHC